MFILKILFYVGCEINQSLIVPVEQRLTIKQSGCGFHHDVFNYFHFPALVDKPFSPLKTQCLEIKRKVGNGV